MAKKYEVADVFQPASFPEHTYVSRQLNERETYETKLVRALQTKGILSFLSGASKSGKTVLCHKVINKDSMVEVSGSHINSIADFWNQIAELLLLPLETETTTSENKEFGMGGSLSAKAGIPLITEGNLGVNSTFKNAAPSEQARGIRQIIDHMLQTQKVLVIDDFHYIKPDIQLSIARILKNEIFYGLKAVVISLPHRSDDAIRLNPDLNGRVSFITIDSWTKTELLEIPQRGFPLLGIQIAEDLIKFLAEESITSPQLMQQICFNLAFDCNVAKIKTIPDQAFVCKTLQYITEDLQYDNIIETLLSGPLHGKSKRKSYALKTGETADLYRIVMLALAEDPPSITIRMDEIERRVANVLLNPDAAPRPLDISNALDQLQKILENAGYKFEYLEWRDQRLNLLNPLFLYYLRWKTFKRC